MPTAQIGNYTFTPIVWENQDTLNNLIIQNHDPHQFHNWEEVFLEIKVKKIKYPNISTRKFINAVKTIKDCTQKSFFNGVYFPELTSLINQIKYYRNENNLPYSFVYDLYLLSRLIKSVKKLKGSDKLFARNIFSNFGMYSQFLVTAYLSKRLKVIDQELDNPPINTDILCEYKGYNLHFHVKDITQPEKEKRMTEAKIRINYELENLRRKYNSDTELYVYEFSEVPPPSLPSNYWNDWAKEIDYKPGIITVNFLENEYGNSYPINIKIVLKPRRASIYQSIDSFSSIRLLNEIYTKVALKAKRHISTEDIHVLVAITSDKPTTQSMQATVNTEGLGLILIDLYSFEYHRSIFILPTKHKHISRSLNKLFPKSVNFIAF